MADSDTKMLDTWGSKWRIVIVKMLDAWGSKWWTRGDQNGEHVGIKMAESE